MIGAYGAAALSLLLSSTAQVLLKILLRHRALSPAILHAPLLWIGLGAYGFSAVLWLAVLARLPLIVAYPLVSLNFVLVALGAHWVLQETLPWTTWVGLACILGGVWLTARP